MSCHPWTDGTRREIVSPSALAARLPTRRAARGPWPDGEGVGDIEHVGFAWAQPQPRSRFTARRSVMKRSHQGGSSRGSRWPGPSCGAGWRRSGRPGAGASGTAARTGPRREVHRDWSCPGRPWYAPGTRNVSAALSGCGGRRLLFSPARSATEHFASGRMVARSAAGASMPSTSVRGVTAGRATAWRLALPPCPSSARKQHGATVMTQGRCSRVWAATMRWR
jgi:hypothetical protein